MLLRGPVPLGHADGPSGVQQHRLLPRRASAAAGSVRLPPSATFHGPGNVVPATPAKAVVKKKAAKCPKGKVRKTVKHKSECVRAKSKKPRKRKKK